MTKRILVIDDDDDVRLLATMSLSRVGRFTVDDADSGETGVAAATAAPPDAILLDVMMPGTDGTRTLALLREEERTRDVPVLFLTAKARAGDHERLLGLGASGVIAKPFDPMPLPAQVSSALGWSGP